MCCFYLCLQAVFRHVLIVEPVFFTEGMACERVEIFLERLEDFVASEDLLIIV